MRFGTGQLRIGQHVFALSTFCGVIKTCRSILSWPAPTWLALFSVAVNLLRKQICWIGSAAVRIFWKVKTTGIFGVVLEFEFLSVWLKKKNEASSSRRQTSRSSRLQRGPLLDRRPDEKSGRHQLRPRPFHRCRQVSSSSWARTRSPLKVTIMCHTT